MPLPDRFKSDREAYLAEVRERNGPMVEVPVKSPSTTAPGATTPRIPEGNGRDWVEPIEEVIEAYRQMEHRDDD